MNVNKIILIGRVGKKPEIFPLNEEEKICKLVLATSERGGEKNITHWHNISIYNQKIINYLEEHVNVGDLIRVEGSISYFESKEEATGNPEVCEIVVPKFSDNVKVFVRKDEEDKHQSTGATLNEAFIVGYAGGPMKVISTNTGNVIGLLSIATSQSWVDKKTGEEKTSVSWHPIVIHHQQTIEYLKDKVNKGHVLSVRGILRIRSLNATALNAQGEKPRHKKHNVIIPRTSHPSSVSKLASGNPKEEGLDIPQ